MNYCECYTCRDSECPVDLDSLYEYQDNYDERYSVCDDCHHAAVTIHELRSTFDNIVSENFRLRQQVEQLSSDLRDRLAFIRKLDRRLGGVFNEK